MEISLSVGSRRMRARLHGDEERAKKFSTARRQNIRLLSALPIHSPGHLLPIDADHGRGDRAERRHERVSAVSVLTQHHDGLV
jgi:hypothetical protein